MTKLGSAWLGPEIALVRRRAIARGQRPVPQEFGLGGPNHSQGFGARGSYPGSAKEIAWFSRPAARPAHILSSMALHPDCLLRHFTGMARHSICLTRQRCSPTAKLITADSGRFAIGPATFLGPAVSHGGDPRKVWPSAPQRCCPRNRSWRFRAAARHDPQRALANVASLRPFA